MLNSTLEKTSSSCFYKSIYQRIFIQGLFLFAMVFFYSLQAFSQDFKPADKIDPVFKYIIAHKNELSDPAVIRNIPSPVKIQPREGYVRPGGALEKRYDCIVYTKNAKALTDNNIIVYVILPTFVTAWVTVDQIELMASLTDVTAIKVPDMLSLHNDLEVANSGATLLHQGRLNNTVYKGKGVIVAVFDTGIDWDHPDFREPADQTKSRILKLWDQTLTVIAGETAPAPFGYGVEYTQAQINDEIDGTPTTFVRERDTNGHGTHVAGTATGNGMALASRQYTGMAPEADIIIVKGGNGSFSSTNIINALSYLQTQATNFGKPIVLNMSLGGQSGPHDGTQAQEIAVDNFTASAAGRAVVISAGNDNGINIHRQLSIAPAGNSSVQLTVPSAAAGTDVFQFTMYANDNTAVTATVTTPTAENVSTPGATAVMGGNFTVNLTNSIDAGSGDRIVNVYITRAAGVGDPVGTWTINIQNNGASAITVDGWLNYISSSYPTTAVVSGNSQYLVGSPGNATSAITVASYVGRNRWNSITSGGGISYSAPAQQDNISLFSSIGPRRDNVLKPEIAANGQAVISCLSSDMTGADVVVTGFYHREQGTSMSSPGVCGAVALLLQANPSATAATIKSLLTTNANSDALTGAVPNTTWGYGRLDVYKAATSIFGCTPVDRRTYQYDNSFTAANDGGGQTQTTGRIAVRFTPDMSGKLGGAYYHSSTTITDLVVEVRANSGGNPGTLLGTLNVPVANLASATFNYIDLSGLNIPVTNGTDYFVILYRSTAVNWSIRIDNAAVDNRSLISTDGGGSWSNPAVDYRIRSVVYNSAQTAGNIANVNAADTRDINTSNQFIAGGCRLIAQLVPNGGSPVTGTVATNVWIEGAVPHVGVRPFVQRHYQLMPSTSPGTATGRVTLYFTQAEFTAFNADAGSTLDLPINAADVANNKANLRVGKFSGISGDGSGMPLTYSGTNSIIDPVDADIIWSAEFSRWEVTFNTTGFSGFIVQTSLVILPVNLEYFTGRKQSASNVLNWKVSCTSNIQFEIQRSSTGLTDDFANIGTVGAAQQACFTPFAFTDASPMQGANYYRLRITESTGKVYYSSIILLQSDVPLTNTVNPTFIPKEGSVQVGYVSGTRGSFIVTDATGRQVYSHSLANGVQSLNLPLKTSGIYLYSIKDDKGATITNGKLIVQ